MSLSDPTAGTFMLPDLGEGLTEAELVEWHVAEGDEVQVDQIVVTVETAKASVDLPCPYAGRVATLHGVVGAVLQVGKPLITIGANETSGSGRVLIGYGTSESKRSHRRRVTSCDAMTSGPAKSGPATLSRPVEVDVPVVAETPVAATALALKVI